jgi:hypothetical protein
MPHPKNINMTGKATYVYFSMAIWPYDKIMAKKEQGKIMPDTTFFWCTQNYLPFPLKVSLVKVKPCFYPN